MTTAYVLGSGPSLPEVLTGDRMTATDYLRDFRRAGNMVIGCNAAIMRYWPAMTHFVCVDIAAPDKWLRVAFNNFDRAHLWLYETLAAKYGAHDKATVWHRRDGDAIMRTFDGKLGCGYTVAYCAVNIAIIHGADRIVLIGVDLSHDQQTGRIHYDDDAATGNVPGLARNLDFWKRMRGGMASAAKQIGEQWPEVKLENASRSQIDGWRGIDPDTLWQ